MAGEQNPRRREEDELASAIPLKEPATSSSHQNLTSPIPFSPTSMRKPASFLPEIPPFSSHQVSPAMGEGKPRARREEDEPHSATPAAQLACTSHPRKLTPCSSTPFSPFSMEKPVSLYTWWLILVGESGKRIALQGLSTRGRKAARMFTSTPIIKRYDAHTLEIADHIAVRINGTIDKARSIANGIPLEVCDRFLNGFPDNWDDFADGNFGEEPTFTRVTTSTSVVDTLYKRSTDNGGIDEDEDKFSMSRIHSALTLMGGKIDDLKGGNFIDTLERFCSYTSAYLTKGKSCLPDEILITDEVDIVNQKNEKSKGCAILDYRDAETLEPEHAEEVGYHRNGSSEHGILVESCIDTRTNCKLNASQDSSLHLSSKFGQLHERVICKQTITPLENGTGLEKNSHFTGPVLEGVETSNDVTQLRKSVSDGMNQSEDKLIGRCSLDGIDKVLSLEKDDGHAHHVETSNDVTQLRLHGSIEKHRHKYNHGRNKGNIGFAESTLESSAEGVSKDPTVTGEAHKVKNNRKNKQASKYSLEVEMNGVKSFPLDKRRRLPGSMEKHRRNHPHKAKVRSAKGTLGSSAKTVGRGSTPTRETQKKGEGHANSQIGRNSTFEIQACDSSVKNAGQLGSSVKVHSSTHKKQDIVVSKIRKRRNIRDVNQADISEGVQPMKDKASDSDIRRKSILVPSCQYVDQSPLARGVEKKLPFATPESLNLKRSRSGRLLVPTLDHGHQNIIYNTDGEIAGITGADVLKYPNTGKQMSRPTKNKSKKRRR